MTGRWRTYGKAAVLWALGWAASLTGQSGGQPGAFLRMGMGTQSMGTGHAGCAAAGLPEAVYWNPAGLSALTQVGFEVTSVQLPWDRHGQQAVLAGPAGRFGSWGAGWMQLRVDGIEKRDFTGRLNGYCENVESAGFLAFGFPLHRDFTVGAALKLLQHQLQDHAAYGVGFDFGMQYQVNSCLRAGITLKDLVTRVRWNTVGETVESYPLAFSAGLSAGRKSLPFSLIAEVSKVDNEPRQIHGGLQYTAGAASIAVGYDDGQLTYGGQLTIPLGSVSMGVGYAAGTDRLSGQMVQRVSLRISREAGREKNTVRQAHVMPKPSGASELQKKQIKHETIQIIKVSHKYKKYGIVNKGSQHGLEMGQELALYRLIAAPDHSDVRQILIGMLEIVRVHPNQAAVQVVHLREGFMLQVGDLCRLRPQ